MYYGEKFNSITHLVGATLALIGGAVLISYVLRLALITIAVMMMYPQVYVDISAINWLLTSEEFHAYLEQLVDARLGERILFGTDQMIWPEAVKMSIEAIESATFLTEEQKQDIY